MIDKFTDGLLYILIIVIMIWMFSIMLSKEFRDDLRKLGSNKYCSEFVEKRN